MYNIFRELTMYNPLLNKKNFPPSSQFEFYIIPFIELHPLILKYNPYYSDPTVGFNFQNYDLLNIAFVKSIKTKYTAYNIFINPISTNNTLRGDYVN